MISLTNHDFQWGRSEVVIIYPELDLRNVISEAPFCAHLSTEPLEGLAKLLLTRKAKRRVKMSHSTKNTVRIY